MRCAASCTRMPAHACRAAAALPARPPAGPPRSPPPLVLLLADVTQPVSETATPTAAAAAAPAQAHAGNDGAGKLEPEHAAADSCSSFGDALSSSGGGGGGGGSEEAWASASEGSQVEAAAEGAVEEAGADGGGQLSREVLAAGRAIATEEGLDWRSDDGGGGGGLESACSGGGGGADGADAHATAGALAADSAGHAARALHELSSAQRRREQRRRAKERAKEAGGAQLQALAAVAEPALVPTPAPVVAATLAPTAALPSELVARAVELLRRQERVLLRVCKLEKAAGMDSGRMGRRRAPAALYRPPNARAS